ncbi:MAG TPA: ATP-binding protein [Holophagaceae bacterium]
MRTRIGTRLILGAGFSTALVIGVMAVLIVRNQSTQLLAERTRSADQLSESIKSGAHYDMLENRRENLHRQIRAIGGLQREGIRKVRVFNKEGRIMFSSDSGEIGTSLDPKGEACYACHAEGKPLERLDIRQRARVFRAADGTRVLGLINPIPNEPSCWTAACHAHSPRQSLLGVLDVNVSLADVDQEIARSRGVMAGMALAAMLAGSLMLWWLNRRLVVRPVAALVAGTRRVAEGDLSTSLPVSGRHELGELAKAFNRMIGRVAETQRQLAQADKLASVGRLAAGVAHEINNPLTGVLSYASLLRKRLEADEAAREDLDVIVRETMRCRGIIRELLDFARPAPPVRKPTDLNEVVKRAVSVVMTQLSLRQVNLRLDLAGDLPMAQADGNQLQQVAVNLLLNAGDALGGEGGAICVGTRSVALPPEGNALIRHARCAAGHDLLDPAVRVAGWPSIRILARHGDHESPMHLDPVFGRHQRQAERVLEEGLVVEHLCPECRRSLEVPGKTCARCGAPLFAVVAGEDDPVYWCSRKGCHETRWPSREAEGPVPCVELSVEDDGRGIDPEDLPRLFEPFFSTKGPRGTGLGLAVTWGIVEAHGGSIEVQSQPGQGTRFAVRIPVSGVAPSEIPSSPKEVP